MGFVLHWQDAEITQSGGFESLSKGRDALLAGRWLAEDGRALGDDFPIELPPALPCETTDGAGSFRLETVMPPLALTEDPPEWARAIFVMRGDQTLARFAVGAGIVTPTPRRPDARRPVPAAAAAAPTRLWVVAECFARGDEEEFFTLVEEMRALWFERYLPFQNAEVRQQLVIEALFWQSSAASGNFATRFPSTPDDRIVQGDQRTLERFLDKAGVPIAQRPFVLVIVRSDTVRGGAGGNALGTAFAWQAAWVTTKADPAEDWRAIALHELGHSFGLLDEYETPYDYPPQPFEPNVHPVGSAAPLPMPWNAMLSASPDPAYEAIVDSAAQEVSRFVGARYSREYVRPSPACLMRHTGRLDAPVDFCPVCAEIIARNLAG